MLSKPGKVVSVKDQIADVLRTEILSGELRPQTKLIESHLAERFGTSRGPIRDAILTLSKEGLLVAGNSSKMLVCGPLNPELAKLSEQLCYQIESFAFEQLKGRLTEQHLTELIRCVSAMEEWASKKDQGKYIESEMSFIQTVVLIAGGQDLVNFWQPMAIRVRHINTGPDIAVYPVERYWLVVAALRDNDVSQALKHFHRQVCSN